MPLQDYWSSSLNAPVAFSTWFRRPGRTTAPSSLWKKHLGSQVIWVLLSIYPVTEENWQKQRERKMELPVREAQRGQVSPAGCKAACHPLALQRAERPSTSASPSPGHTPCVSAQTAAASILQVCAPVCTRGYRHMHLPRHVTVWLSGPQLLYPSGV